MKNAKPEDRPLIIDLLANSFIDNQSVNYIVKQDNKKLARIRSLMEYSFDVCFMFGEVLLSDDRKSCVLILYPHLKRTTLESIFLDVKLIFKAITIYGLAKAMKRESMIKDKRSKEAMIYLWFIAVDTMYQHQGIGSSLLQEVVLMAKNDNLPVYLETSTLKNISWYRKFGFQIYNQLDLNYTLFFLKLVSDPHI